MPEPYETSRFVGFVDVLGYKAIVRDAPFAERQRFHYLHSLFGALASSAHDIALDFSREVPVRAVQFSDSFYFSSESAATIVTAIANFFANAITLYDHTMNDTLPGDEGTFPEWLPFLRGGIVKGWMFEGYDITLPKLQDPREGFRNPIGPAVANAYLLSEETGLDGMRLVTTRDVYEAFVAELPTIPRQAQLGLRSAPLTPLFLKDFEGFGAIFEVPWFESRLLTDNTSGTYDSLIAAERQFSERAMRHFRGTWDAILRTPSLEHQPGLRDRARSIRHGVVSRMAHANWIRRDCPHGSPWFDWFVAEGIIRPEKQ